MQGELRRVLGGDRGSRGVGGDVVVGGGCCSSGIRSSPAAAGLAENEAAAPTFNLQGLLIGVIQTLTSKLAANEETKARDLQLVEASARLGQPPTRRT